MIFFTISKSNTEEHFVIKTFPIRWLQKLCLDLPAVSPPKPSSNHPHASAPHLPSTHKTTSSIHATPTIKPRQQLQSPPTTLLELINTFAMASAGDRPYDPYIPSEPAAGGAGAQPAPGNQRTAALQAVSNYLFRRTTDILLDQLSTDGLWI
jgi:hypothetical protein